MKLVNVVLLMMFSVCAYAQPGGGGMGGGMQGGGQMGGGMQGGQRSSGGGMQNIAEMDLVGSTGIFALDTDLIIKKCKIKDEGRKAGVKMIIGDYNTAMGNISDANKEMVKKISDLQDKISKGAEITSFRNDLRPVMMSVNKIKTLTVSQHTKLSSSMIATLTEKELKKWVKYYADLCEDKTFTTQVRQARSQNQEGQQGQNRGQRPSGGGQMGGGMR